MIEVTTRSPVRCTLIEFAYFRVKGSYLLSSTLKAVDLVHHPKNHLSL